MHEPMAPRAFHVMAKPTGARCNLRCDYCFFLDKARLYPGSDFRMRDEVMEQYLRQTIAAHRVPQVTIAWQGGEPTLMGLDFFQRAVALAQQYRKPGMTIEHTLQTNGVLLDDAWCRFFREQHFLIGISLDGPRELHDAYRHDGQGRSVFDRVENAVRLLQRHHVDYNILCTVNAVNSRHPREVYHYFTRELGACYLQFIPIVEREPAASAQQQVRVTDSSVDPAQYGRFLITIFDEWVRHDVGERFVQFFDGVLAAWVRGRSTLCVLSPTCGEGVALEHNGDVYACDHYVEPEYRLGNIMTTPLAHLVGSAQQQAFGARKHIGLPQYCRHCEFLFTCHGECPKHRLLATPDGEPGLNYLCAGLQAFFRHTAPSMRIMAELLKYGQPAAQIMSLLAREAPATPAQTGRNALCPCGSGRKYKQCCSQRADGGNGA